MQRYTERLCLSITMVVIWAALLLGKPVAVSAGDPVISQSDAWTVVKSEVLQNNFDGKWVYAGKEPLTAGSVIETWNCTIEFPFDNGWFFFIDDRPLAGWEHPCRYVFIDMNRNISVQSGTTPPKNIMELENLSGFPGIQNNKNSMLAGQVEFGSAGYTESELAADCFAVIISGGYDTYNNWMRYWNDSSFIYKTLTQVYGYSDDHIYVLMSDGQDPADDRHQYEGPLWYDSSPLDLDGDGDDDVDYSATKANITAVFDILQNTLGDKDYLFIFSTDHGGQDYGPGTTVQDAVLYLWGEYIRDDEFAAEVNKISYRCEAVSIMMEQCFSGGFIDDLIDGPQPRVIATASSEEESSWAMWPDYVYDEFSYYWTCAMAGKDPSGAVVDADSNGSRRVSMREAFNYSQAHDTAWETPQYADNPSGIGASFGLLPVQINPVGGEIQPAGKAGLIWLLAFSGCALVLAAGAGGWIFRRYRKKEWLHG